MSEGFVVRGLRRVRKLLESPGPLELEGKPLGRVRDLLRECASGVGGEVSVRQRAALLAETYQHLNDDGRTTFLSTIANDFGPDPQSVARTHADYQAAIGSDQQWTAESALRNAMRSSRLRILTQFNALPQGVKFLVDLRADLLRFLDKDPALRSLDRELESRLSAWFDVGFLEPVSYTHLTLPTNREV